MKEHITDFVDFFKDHPYSAPSIGLFLCGLGMPIPEEFFLVMSGYVSYLNWGLERPPYAMMVVTLMAVAGGDTMVFFLGRHFGPRVFEMRLVARLVSEDRRRKAERFLAQHGPRTFVAARFMPGIRMAVYLLSGALGVPFRTFLFYDGMAMIVSVPIQVYLAWRYGQVLDEAILRVARLNRFFLLAAITLGLVIYIRWHLGVRSSVPAPPPAGGPGPAGGSPPPVSSGAAGRDEVG